MITFDEVGAILDEIAVELPKEFYRDLNGGVNLVDDTRIHPESGGARDLYIVGQYHYEPMGLGRYIAIYYGSFVSLYGDLPLSAQKDELRKVLIHEFTHHLESLAGERDLEIKDAVELAKYRRRFRQKGAE